MVERSQHTLPASPMSAASTMDSGATITTLKSLFAGREYDAMHALLLQHQECEEVHVDFFNYVVTTLEPLIETPGDTVHQMQLMKTLVHSSDMVRHATETMQRFVYNQDLQQSCCTCLRYAFDVFVANIETVAPCCAALFACMATYPSVAKLQFTCCCVLEAVVRVCPNHANSAHLAVIHHDDTVNMVHKAMFLEQREEDDLAMKMVCCKIIAAMGRTWRFAEYANDASQLRKNSIDSVIVHAMGKYWHSGAFSIYACQALSVLITLNRVYFTNTFKGIQMAVNSLQASTHEDVGDASCFLALLAFDEEKQQTHPENQLAIGRTGVISLALCSLNKLFQENSVALRKIAVMENIVNLLCMLALGCTDNQNRILVTNSPGLLLGIVKMRHPARITPLETHTLRLLYILQMGGTGKGKKMDPSCFYNMVSNEHRIIDTPNVSLMDAFFKAMHKPGAPAELITNGLRLLGAHADAFVLPNRDPASNTFGMAVIRQIMLPATGFCSDKHAHLGMELLEKLSKYPFFAENADVQAVLAGMA